MPRNSRSLDTEMSKISIRLTSTPRKQVEERAKATGKNVFDFVREFAECVMSLLFFYDIMVFTDEIQYSVRNLIFVLDRIQSL